MKKTVLFFLLIPAIVFAQKPELVRDTSFTTHSAFLKDRKKYPEIQIVKAQLPDGVKTEGNIPYTSGDRALHLDIFYPVKKTKKGYPGVLLIHGGGWKTGDKSQTIPMAQRLAAKGYVTVSVEYRLSPEAPFPAALFDIKAAVRWMRAHAAEYNIDTAKIAAWGFSAGGQLAALTGTTNGMQKFEGDRGHTKHSGAVQAVIDIDGLLAFKHPESEEGVSAALWLGGTFEEKPVAWQEASALSHVGAHTPPMLFINSTLPRFHAGRDDMIKKMEALKIYSEVHTLADTPHTFSLYHPWFETTVTYTVAFLDKLFK